VSLDAEGLTAVVVNWRTPDQTRRAVAALVANGVPPERVIVVDNGSGGGDAEALGLAFDRSTVLPLPENVGYGAACNAGARSLPAAAYLLVNSDAFAQPGSVAALVAALGDPHVGIAVPRLVNEDASLQASVVPLSTPLPELVRASGLSRFVPNRLQPRLGTHWDHSSSRRIQAAVGAVLLVRGEAWVELGGFDERRHMFAEEHDLFWRAAKAGWAAQFVAEAEFVHLGGASTARRWIESERAARVAEAETAVIRTHLSRLQAALTIGLMALGVGARSVVYRALGHSQAASTQAAWFRGYVHGLRHHLRRSESR
jgi:GT2 family glycosyltransferase